MLVMVMQPTEAEYLVERMKRYYLFGVTIYIVKTFNVHMSLPLKGCKLISVGNRDKVGIKLFQIKMLSLQIDVSLH